MGGAVAANRCEGGYLEDGKKASVPDMLPGGDRYTPRTFLPQIDETAFYPSHEAADFYHHYKEDIALFAGMGWKVYPDRYSIFLLIIRSPFDRKWYLMSVSGGSFCLD